MITGRIKRKHLARGNVALFISYIDSRNEIEGQLIVDYIAETDTYLLQPARRFRINMKRGLAYWRFTQPRPPSSHVICYLKNGIVNSIEIWSLKSNFAATTGRPIATQKITPRETLPTSSVLLMRLVSCDLVDDSIVVAVKGARIIKTRDDGAIVVGTPEIFESQVSEYEINSYIERARVDDSWLIGTLICNEIVEIKLTPKANIIRETSLTRAV